MNSPFGWRGWLRKLLNPKVEANIYRILAKVANAEVLFVHRFSMGGSHGFPHSCIWSGRFGLSHDATLSRSCVFQYAVAVVSILKVAKCLQIVEFLKPRIESSICIQVPKVGSSHWSYKSCWACLMIFYPPKNWYYAPPCKMISYW